MQVCKYVCTDIYMYAYIQLSHMQLCNFMHEWIYKTLQIFKCESKPVCMCAGMHGWTHEKLHKIEMMQVYKYQVCKYISMQIFICIFIQVCRRTSM